MIDVTSDFDGDVLGQISIEDAIRRVLAFCTDPGSGWGAYDLAGVAARSAGVFDEVTPWSLLWANLLNGNVTLANVAAFDLDHRRTFAELLAAVPTDYDLSDIDDRGSIVSVCEFRSPGVWGPKITKVAALYRPHAVPVLDSYVALAFGLRSDAFSTEALGKGLGRRERISSVIDALAIGLREHRSAIGELRKAIEATIPEITMITDLRLLDLVLWTSEDDRHERTSSTGRVTKRKNRWRDAQPGERIPLDGLDTVSI